MVNGLLKISFERLRNEGCASLELKHFQEKYETVWLVALAAALVRNCFKKSRERFAVSV